jgi:glycosyltransferase involved in cell wall biosynthesis
MKVLIPVYPFCNSGYPVTHIVDGLLTSLYKEIDALVDLGHDVTLLTSKNFPVLTDTVQHIAGDFLSKEESGQMPWAKYTEAICEHGDKFDVILLNSSELKLDRKDLREKVAELGPKLRVIYHHYDDRPFASFLVTQYQAMAWVVKHGGRVTFLSKFFASDCALKFLKKPNCISGNPYHIPELPTEDFSSMFEWINILMVEEKKVAGDLQSNGDFVVIGRPVPEKNIDMAINAFLLSGVEGKLHVFTYEPTRAKKSTNMDYYEKLRKIESDKVIWHLSADREEIYSVLKESSVLIFSSKKESLGLVPLEAASCGMRVIYGEKHAYYMEEEGYWVSKPTVKGYAEAVKNVGLPTVQEKIERRAKYIKMYDGDRFAKEVENFLQPRV